MVYKKIFTFSLTAAASIVSLEAANTYSNNPNTYYPSNTYNTPSNYSYDQTPTNSSNNYNQNSYPSSYGYDSSSHQGQYYSNQNPTNFPTQNSSSSNSSSGMISSDRELQNRIQGLLFAPSLQGVIIRVNRGDVFLTGFFETDQDRLETKTKISNLSGVKSINDKTEIRLGFQKNQGQLSYNDTNTRATYADNSQDLSSSSFQNSTQASSLPKETDLQLKRKVVDALKSGFFSKKFANIQVDVQNSIVTLTGNIDTESDSKRAEDQVKKLSGVKQVVNQLKIQYTRSN